jgi:hypothetical protein
VGHGNELGCVKKYLKFVLRVNEVRVWLTRVFGIYNIFLGMNIRAFSLAKMWREPAEQNDCLIAFCYELFPFPIYCGLTALGKNYLRKKLSK